MQLFALLSVLFLSLLAGDDPEPWKDRIVLREEQGGIAGTQVRIWELEPAGMWRSLRFRLDSDGKEVAESRQETTGQLSPERCKDIAALIHAQQLTRLPARLGKESPINPHRYVLSLGKSQATVEGLAPRRDDDVKDNILQAAPREELQATSPWSRFAVIAQEVCTICK